MYSSASDQPWPHQPWTGRDVPTGIAALRTTVSAPGNGESPRKTCHMLAVTARNRRHVVGFSAR